MNTLLKSWRDRRIAQALKSEKWVACVWRGDAKTGKYIVAHTGNYFSATKWAREHKDFELSGVRLERRGK